MENFQNMAKKNIETLYDTLFNMRAAMEDILQNAEGFVNDVSEYGGELNRVCKEQMSKYFIPEVTKLIKDENTPGSIVGLIRFMDSLPLAMTRVEPSVENIAPVVPDNANVDEPAVSKVDALPQNASFANKPAPVVNESLDKIKESSVDYKAAFQKLVDGLDITSGPFGEEIVKASSHGFAMADQGGVLTVVFDPSNEMWHWVSVDADDDTSVHDSGVGFNKLIKSLFMSDVAMFVATDHKPEEYFI